MKIGYFAPLPPAPTGVADYARALLDALAAAADVRVGEYGDIPIYQLGNNQLHRDVYRRALERPGVVLLHDACLNHFFLGALSRDAYVAAFCLQYGAWHRALAEALYDGRARSGADRRYFKYAMLRETAARARAVIVHNPAAATVVEREAPGARVFEVPHLVETASVAEREVVSLRAKWGVKGHECVFGVFGHLRESKRLASVLRAFHRTPGVWLLVAGRFVSDEYRKAIAPLLDADHIIRAGFLSEHDFWVHASAVDASINLRDPSCGETSGISIRLMGLGKPVIVSAGGEYARFPGDCLLPVDRGVAEEEILAAWIAMLGQNRQMRSEIGRRARALVMREHAPALVAQRVVEILRALE